LAWAIFKNVSVNVLKNIQPFLWGGEVWLTDVKMIDFNALLLGFRS
jgi:hypothetical protein